MRTVTVDTDHVARFERVAKGCYRFTVEHAASNRFVLEGHTKLSPGADADKWVARIAGERLLQHGTKRIRDSQRFAAGKPVPGAPARGQLPPEQRAAIEAGQLDIEASLPMKLIQDAFKLSQIPGETMASWLSRRSHAALGMGHKVLIGVTDEIILGIAQGKIALRGSLRNGVTVEAVA
jgi:hypothetical protein